MFNGIEFRGIWWEEQKFAANIPGSRNKPLFGMKRSIIHYDNGTLVKDRQKIIYKPEFKKSAVHRSTILKWGKNLIRHFGGNNTAALIFSATDLPEYLLTSWRIPVFPIQVSIYSAFININYRFGWYVFDLFLIRCYFLLILLLVPSYLFFLVILSRRSASRMPLSLHPNTSAISD